MSSTMDVAEVPQSAPLDERQVLNSTGGYVFQLDDLGRLRRFLILGAEGGSYYASQQQLKYENAHCVMRLLDAGKGAQVVAEVVEVSEQGRAPKQATGIFVLAMCARLGDKAARQAAMQAVPRVCRTASTLFEFVERCKELGQVAAAAAGGAQPASAKASWGRAMRRAVAHWYLERDPSALAYQVTKYSQRSGWSHADLLRLAHPDALAHATKRFPQQEQADQAAGQLAAAEQPAIADEAGDGEPEEAGSVLTPAAGAAAWLADMRSIFAFLTHGSLPGQPAAPKGASRKRKAEAAPEAEPAAAAAAADANRSEAASPPTPSPPTAPARPSGLSPVMQYIVDAQYLRKQLRAPQPYTPPQAQGEVANAGVAGGKRRKAGGGRGRGRGRGFGGRGFGGRGLGPAGCIGAEAEAGIGGAGTAAQQQCPQEDPGEAAKRAEAAAALRAAVEEACALVRRHRFGHEHVGDTQLLKQPALWATFLEVGMPITALVRNLGRLSALGVLDSQEALGRVTRALRSPQAVRRARLHPLTLLGALRTYSNGCGTLGGLSWVPHQAVKEALEDAFYLAFDNVEPTRQRLLLALDVSGSMTCAQCVGMKELTPRDASAAMAMAFVRREPSVHTMAFAGEFTPLALRAGDRLDEVMGTIERASRHMSGTDCAMPMLYALEHRVAVDAFLVWTDNETYFGRVHPRDALKRYRREMGIDAKLIVFGCSSTSFTIADPSDPGMLDVVGMDSAVPRLVADFMAGKV